jgi:hypothetical protein
MYQPLNRLLKLLAPIALVFILCGTTAIKDSAYFQMHLDEAAELRKGRCNTTANDKFTKDAECAAVIDALDKEQQTKERDELIGALRKMKEKISASVKFAGDDQRKFELLMERFSKDYHLTEDFLSGCIGSSQRVSQNGLECLAAVNVMLQSLEKAKEQAIAENDKQIKYKEYYKQYFKERPTEVNELLTGRCKELFANPWYNYENELQDKECNAALAEQQRQKRLSKLSSNQKKRENDKNFEYFKKNIPQAKLLIEECKSGELDEISCRYASKAVAEREDADAHEKLRLQYNNIFKSDLMAAKHTYDACIKATTKNDLKCDIAGEIINNESLKKKENNEFQRYFIFYRSKIDEAKKLENGRCKLAKDVADEFSKDIECFAAIKAIREDFAFKTRDKLIDKIAAAKENLLAKYPFKTEDTKKTYDEWKETFTTDAKAAAEFIMPCLQDSMIAAANSTKCIAAATAMIENLKTNREKDITKMHKDAAFNDDYQSRLRFLRQNPETVKDLLDGRCKPLFADPWYDYDPDVQDSECNAALNAIDNIKKQERITKAENEKSAMKTVDYYKKNAAEGKALAEDCKNGVVANIDSCNFAMQATTGLIEDAKKRIEYTNYYSNHILSAQFRTRLCKAIMTQMTLECQIVSEVLKKHTDKVLNPELFKKFSEFYHDNPFEAKITAMGTCSDLLNDKWYFMDKDLQTEECNAVAEVLD